MNSDDSAASSLKQLLKNANLPQTLAQSAFQALSFQAREITARALAQQRNRHHHVNRSAGTNDSSIFDFASTSVDEELESTMTLWKYSLNKLLQIGNENDLMHGTQVTEGSVERLKAVLVGDYKARDSFQ